MTGLLVLKQKIKGFYSENDIYLLPIGRFALALIYFIWINSNMGYMQRLDNLFVDIILALICGVLPSVVTVFVGFILIFIHGYAFGSLEVLGFLLVMILLMVIFLLRFTKKQSICIAFAPVTLGLNIGAILPIGASLLEDILCAIPIACGTIIYYFIRFIKLNIEQLQSSSIKPAQKIQILAGGIANNTEMWIYVVTFIAVVLIVNIIRRRSFDYAWRYAILVGAVVYAVLILLLSSYLDVEVSVIQALVNTIISIILGFIIEFFAFGGDYSRTERLTFDDDEYYYYVKAVPKAIVNNPSRKIKKINAENDEEYDLKNKLEKSLGDL